MSCQFTVRPQRILYPKFLLQVIPAVVQVRRIWHVKIVVLACSAHFLGPDHTYLDILGAFHTRYLCCQFGDI